MEEEGLTQRRGGRRGKKNKHGEKQELCPYLLFIINYMVE